MSGEEEKQTKEIPLPAHVYEKLEKKAKKKGVSLSAYAEELLLQIMDSEGA